MKWTTINWDDEGTFPPNENEMVILYIKKDLYVVYKWFCARHMKPTAWAPIEEHEG